MPIGTPEGFLDITNATLRTSVVGISNTGPTGELSVGSNLHVNTTASNVLQVVGNTWMHNLTLGTINMTPAYGLENVTEVGNTTPFTVSFSNATTGLATTSNLHVGGSLKVGVIDFVNPGLTLATVTNNSNVTPYTVDLRNATTGLVTTANVIVGKDLQVAGNVSLTGSVTSNLHLASNLEVGTANLFVNPATSNVGIGTNLPLAKLHVNGTFYAPGTTIQTIANNIHTRNLYSVAASRDIPEFDVVITPRFATSKILIRWVIQYSPNDVNHIWRILRNGTTIGYNTDAGLVNWSGVASQFASSSANGGTLTNSTIEWVDTPNTTGALTYRLQFRNSSVTGVAVGINRTYDNLGTNNYENGVSFVTATELAQ